MFEIRLFKGILMMGTREPHVLSSDSELVNLRLVLWQRRFQDIQNDALKNFVIGQK